MQKVTIPTNIFLVGPMGVGKTTIGRQLAFILKMSFKDSDQEIEERTGATIPLIFELEGEAGFRKREQKIIAELTAEQNIVLSTGGGVVLDPTNRAYLRSRGYVVYLYATIDELLSRTAHCRNRPLLQTENPRERLEHIFLERQPLYLEVADATVDTGQRTIRQVVRAVLRHIQKRDSL